MKKQKQWFFPLLIFMITSLVVVAQCMRNGQDTGKQIAMLKSSTQDKNKQAALDELGKIMLKAHRHQGSLLRMGTIIAGARQNLDALKYISQLVADVPFHTQVLLSVAVSAGQAKRTMQQFRDIAELAVIKLSESSLVTALAKWAAAITTDEDVMLLDEKIIALKKSAECQTVEEAMRAVDSMLEKIEKQLDKL